MAIIKRNADINVVEAARKRIINTFSNRIPVAMSFSGGKDSIVMAHLVYELIRQGKVNPDYLEVDFFDEEAIFPCVEKSVMEWKEKFEEIGVKFNWYCLECYHNSAYNTLIQNDKFITWDEKAKDVWVRKKPKFAITSHPSHSPRIESFQDFFSQKNMFKISMIGDRVYESWHRLKMIGASTKFSGGSMGNNMHSYPIYDFDNDDVWIYIREHDLEFPDAYIYLWEQGTQRRNMRISQLFSIDVSGLNRLYEMYPDLMERVMKREPNVYLATLYWDTDMFRRSTHENKRLKKAFGVEDTECKEKCLKLIKYYMDADKDADENRGWKSKSKHNVHYKTAKSVRNFILGRSKLLNNKDWCKLLSIVQAGDPKGRALRPIGQEIAGRLKDAEMWEEKK